MTSSDLKSVCYVVGCLVHGDLRKAISLAEKEQDGGSSRPKVAFGFVTVPELSLWSPPLTGDSAAFLVLAPLSLYQGPGAHFLGLIALTEGFCLLIAWLPHGLQWPLLLSYNMVFQICFLLQTVCLYVFYLFIFSNFSSKKRKSD